MENASKALLIAAAVLIVILLIAFGMRIFNSTSGTTDSLETTMSSTEAVSFNNKFNGYMGTQSIQKAKALVNIILANNKQSNHVVEISYSIWTETHHATAEKNSGNQIYGTLINILSTALYPKVAISVEEYDENGYIKVIKFDDKH